ncbi:hypothetical protein ACP275_11G074800 [Erythranthe tilingii]
MGKCLLQFLILLTSLLQIMASSEKRFCLSRDVIVYVVNSLPPNSSSLLFHCASGDNDLGYHSPSVGQNFNFDFCVKENILFFCHLWWDQKDAAFEVFNEGWHDDRCRNEICYWEARSDGIYFSNDYPPMDMIKEYDWSNTTA